MSSWTPKDPPVGQVPAGILQLTPARKKKRGRPKREAAPYDSPVESAMPSQGSDTNICDTPKTVGGTDRTDSKSPGDDSSNPSTKADSTPGVSPDSDIDAQSPVVDSATRFTRRRDKARYSAPRQMHSMRDVELFDEYTKRFHSSPDMRLVGDVSKYNPPADWPQHLQAPSHPVQVPGIDVRKEPMRPPRRQMSDEDGYYDQDIPVDSLPRFFDAIPHDYTVDQHVISARASIQWIDSGGFCPSDVRARRLKIFVPPEDAEKKPDETIWRVTYTCNGLCRSLPPEKAVKAPALATKDLFAPDLFNWAKDGSKERRRLAQRRLSPRASQMRIDRIAKEAEEANASSSKENTGKEGSSASPSDAASEGKTTHACQNTACSHESHSDHAAEEAQSAPESREGSQLESNDEDTNTTTESDNESRSTEESLNDQKKGKECACSSYLMISMTNAQTKAGQCTVRMRRESHHPRPRHGVFVKMSPYVRRMLDEMAGCFSMTKSKLKLWYQSKIEGNDQHVIWLNSCKRQKDKAFMAKRLPGKNAWTTAIRTSAKSYRVHSSPLAAIEIIAERCPEAMIAHRGPRFLKKGETDPGDPENPSTGRDGRERMECVIAPPLARLSAILQIFRMGMMMDTSWRNKNAWGAPMSVLVTLNEQHHMIPLAVMVSAHADHIAYEYLLREFQRACMETAMDVIAGSFRPEIEGVSEADLVKQCKIFQKEGLSPRFMMIDRSHAERIAIENVFPNIPFRVCQFHMMQAIGRRIKRIYGRRDDRDILAAQTLEDIRLCQRCDDHDEWGDHYRALERSVRSRSPDDPEAWPMLDRYLQDEWFNEAWKDAVVDFGLPLDVTRNGPWSTNNYSEACFRTFDRVFLSCRANHRLDRLILVLIDAFFPFYEDFEGGLPRPDSDLQVQLFGGLHRWEVGCVHPCPVDAVPVAHRNRFGSSVFCVLPPKRQVPQSSTQFCGKTPRGNDVCTCDYWSGTGKRCVHLWAMVAYDLLGSVFDFEENAAVIEHHLRLRGIGAPTRPPPIAGKKRGRGRVRKVDNEDAEDFKKFWGEELDGAEQSRLNSHPRMFETFHDKSSAEPITPPAGMVTKLALSEAGDSAGDSSPIGRRFATPATDSAEQEQAKDDAEGSAVLPPSAWSHSQPGAPPAIRPLQPNRVTRKREPIRTLDSPDLFAPTITASDQSKAQDMGIPRAQRSTLGLSRKAQKQVAKLKPVGIRNTGNDCYILSLFQVMARVHTWDNALYHDFVAGKLSDCPEYQVWRRVRDALRGSEAKEFPELRPTLFDAGLIQDSAAMGDPFDLFERVFTHFDEKAVINALSELTNVRRFTHHICPHHDSKFENLPVSSVLIYPLRDGAPQNDTIATMLEDSIQADSLSYPCGCGADKQGRSFDILSPILTLHVVWGLQTESGSDTVQIGRPFDIPPMLEFGDHVSRWELKGVIIRYGIRASAGHFVAIVPQNDKYWRIDDEDVKITGNIGQEAFKNAGYPVMLVYEQQGAADFIPPGERGAAELDMWGEVFAAFDVNNTPAPADDTAVVPQVEAPFPLPLPASDANSTMTSVNHDLSVSSAHLSFPWPLGGTLAGEGMSSAPIATVPDQVGLPSLNQIATPAAGQMLATGQGWAEGQPVPTSSAHPSVPVEQPLGSLRSPSVQWLRDAPGWSDLISTPLAADLSAAQIEVGLAPSAAISQPTTGAGPPVTSLGNALLGWRPPPSMESTTRSTATQLVTPDAHASIPQADESWTSPGTPTPHPLATPATLGQTERVRPIVSPEEVMRRYHELDFWKAPHLPIKQQRILWCEPATQDTLSPRTPREPAVDELLQSLSSVQVPLDQPRKDLFSHGLRCGDSGTIISCDDFSRIVKPKEWFSSTLCDAAANIALHRLNRLETQAQGNTSAAGVGTIVKYAVQMLPWVEGSNDSAVPRFARKGLDGQYTSLPWPGLGRDRTWRDRITVGIINVYFKRHFICLVIFGPGRLVIPFDGYGGVLVHAELRKRWDSLLSDRLEYELQKGWVQEKDNEGWIFAPNSSEMRSALDWPFQTDGHSCGPLAVAAAVLIMQGLKPNRDGLGISNPLARSWQWSNWLRDSILIMLVEEASDWAMEQSRPGGRLGENLPCWRWIAEVKRDLRIP